MISLGLSLLLMLNPVALFLYLKPVVREHTFAEYMRVVWKAALIAGVVYALFIVTGDSIFTKVFQIDFNSFRFFGGIIVSGFALMYLLHGREGFINMRGDLDDVAQQLALPFMVGAGSISVSVLIGYEYPRYQGLGLLVMVMVACVIILIGLWALRRYCFPGQARVQFDRILTIVFRLNSFLMGAVGIDMIVTAIKNLFLS